MEGTLLQPTEENLLNLFGRMNEKGAFREAVETAKTFLNEALESIEKLPFDSSEVVSLIEDYFEGVFARFEKTGG